MASKNQSTSKSRMIDRYQGRTISSGGAASSSSSSSSASSSSSSSSSSTSSGVHEFSMEKKFGQNLLTNTSILNSIVDKAQIKSTDVVLEIGPGTGNLTVRMLKLAKKVIVVEIDPRMVSAIQKRVQGQPYASKLKILFGDAIKVPFPYFDVCVANTPFQISSPLVFKLLAHRPFFRTAVLMFQKEFAVRLTARPADSLYCRLSVNTQLLSRVTQVLKVGRANFRPPPKVDASVVRLVPLVPPPPINFIEWDGLARLVFSRKNKTVGAIFRHKTVLSLVVDNYIRYCKLTDTPLPDLDCLADPTKQDGEDSDDGEDDNDEADEDDAASSDDEDADAAEEDSSDEEPEVLFPGLVAEGFVAPKSQESAGTEEPKKNKQRGSRAKHVHDKRLLDWMKARLSQILKDADLDTRRASKLSVDKLLQLLAVLNEHGIHFTTTTSSNASDISQLQ